ncbi:MAG: DNA methyltransferase [Parvibaculales bacterium]
MISINSVKSQFNTLKFDSDWAFSQEKYECYSHNYHRYPAKFISPLVHKLIKENSVAGDKVCDPFGGCGTTLLEAKLMGREGVGFDINPVAKLITEVKSKAIEPNRLECASRSLLERLDVVAYIENDYDTTHERIRYWFDEESYLSLQHIYQVILKEENENIQKFFICAFSHCLKNNSRWLMKSIKPTIDKNKPSINANQNFIRHLKGMIKKNTLLYNQLKDNRNLSLSSKIYLADITVHNKDLSVDLIITSPPYVTSYEYGDLHQLTLLWLGHKKFKGWQKYLNDFRLFKSKFIGSNVKLDIQCAMNSSIAESIVKNLQEKNRSLANKASTYFTRMNKSFRVMRKLVKKSKKACIVLGNTKLLGVPILNAEVAYQQLSNIGFHVEKVIKRNANSNKLIAPYRDSDTGKFTSINSKNKIIAYHEEFILKVIK